MVQEEEMSQLEQILNEKEEDYRARISNLEQAHEQDILEYQDTIAKLKQGMILENLFTVYWNIHPKQGTKVLNH